MEEEAVEFQTLLGLAKDRHLVGVRFLFSEAEYQEAEGKEATHQMFFCMMVKAAAVGHGMKVRKEHIYCSAAAEALGFAKPLEESEPGEILYKRNMYGTREVAADIRENMPCLKHEVYGMCIQPLEQSDRKPDVVLVFCQPYTAMRIVQGYSYQYGFAKQVRFAGMSGICTELMAGAYKNQDMNLSLLCSGTRFAGAWRDDELGIAFPYGMFQKVLSGVRSTVNTFEPDDKKEAIRQRAWEYGGKAEVEMGNNYHGSSIGVARMGVEGYFPKKAKSLTSGQRMARFYRGEKIDRVPMLSCATMYAGWQKGLSSEEFYFDVKKAFHAQKEIAWENGYDDVPCYDLPHGEILDLGGELAIPETGRVGLPMVKRFAVNSAEDALAYELPPMEKRRFTRLRIAFLRYAKSQGQNGVTISAGSPFTMVGSMVETGLLMRWLIKEPELVRRLLRKAVQYLSETADLFIQEFGLENCSVSSNYPFESNPLISPRNFERFAYPAMMEIHEEMRKKGLQNFGLHLCGNHVKTMAYFKDLNLAPGSFISLDEENPLTETAKALGEEMIYAGNISTKLLVGGTPEQVYRQSERAIREMKYHKGGFILMPSCDLPINAKPENLKAMLDAACEVGKY